MIHRTPYLFRAIAPAALLLSSSTLHAQSPARTPATPLGIEQGGFKVFWEARLPLGSGETIERGYFRDDAVYVTTTGGIVFALHADTGLLRWGEILTEPSYTIFAPSHVRTADNRGPVIIPTTNQVYVKDRYSGKDLIRFKPEFPIGSGAVGFDGVLLVGSTNGRFYSLGWDALRPAEPIKRWDVETGGPISANPMLYPPKSLLIASQSGNVYSCMADNKVLGWRFKVGGPIFGDPFVDESGAYIPSMDRSLYKLHPTNGNALWRVRFPDPLRTGPVVAAQTVFQFSPSQGITALDSVTGSEKWSHRNATQFVAHGTTGDVLLSGSDRLLVVDNESGNVTSTISIPPVIAAVENAVNDSVYLLGAAGRVQCLRPDKVPYLRKQQVEMAQETLNSPPAIGRTTEQPPPPRPVPPREDPFRSRHDQP